VHYTDLWIMPTCHLSRIRLALKKSA